MGLFQLARGPLSALEASTHSPHCQLLQGTSDTAPRLGEAGAKPVFQCPQYPPGLATWLSTAYVFTTQTLSPSRHPLWVLGARYAFLPPPHSSAACPLLHPVPSAAVGPQAAQCPAGPLAPSHPLTTRSS